MNALEKSLSISICFLSTCCLAGSAPAQTLADLPDAPSPVTATDDARANMLDVSGGLAPSDSSAQTQSPRVDNTTGVPQREATWRSMPGDFLHDQKGIWTFPVRLFKGHSVLPTAIVVGTTVGLIYADPHIAPYFR